MQLYFVFVPPCAVALLRFVVVLAGIAFLCASTGLTLTMKRIHAPRSWLKTSCSRPPLSMAKNQAQVVHMII
jgi:hypothetical protein